LKKYSIVLALLLIVTLFAGSSLGADWTNNYTEDFDTDTVDSNPSDTFYSYSESQWGYANVTNITYKDTPNCYWINDTDGKATTVDYSQFDFTNQPYDYFQFWFKLNTTTSTGSYATLIDRDGKSFVDIQFDITNGVLKIYNYTNNIIVQTITNDAWYKLRFDFNSSNEVWCRLYDATDVLKNSSTLVPNSEASGEFAFNYFDKIKFYGADGKNAYIFIDIMNAHAIHTSVRLRDDDNLSAVEIAMIILLGTLFVLGVIYTSWKSFTEGSLDFKALMMRIIFVAIAVSIIGVIMSVL